MKRVLIGFLLLLATFVVRANEIEFTEVKKENDYTNLLLRAKEENKLLFIDAYTDWCTYCKELDQKVYTNNDLAEFYNEHFINVKFDAESEFGSMLARKFQIDSYPTMLFLSSEEVVFDRVIGFHPAPSLQAYGDRSLLSFEKYPSLISSFESKSIQDDDLLELIGIQERINTEYAAQMASEYVSRLEAEDYSNIENIWLVSRYENGLEDRPYLYISSHKNEIIETHGNAEYLDYISSIYNDNLALSIKYGDENLMERLIVEVLPNFIEEQNRPNAIFTTRSIYYAERAEYDKYQLAINSYMNNHLTTGNRLGFLLDVVYNVLENYFSEANLEFLDTSLTREMVHHKESFEGNAILGYVKTLRTDIKGAEEFFGKAEKLTSNEEEVEMLSSLKEALDIVKSN